MKTFIALLRGINVGGHRKLPMKELRDYMTLAGLFDVQTYIQSGNVVFKSKHDNVDSLETLFKETILAHHGFSPDVMILEKETFLEIADLNPFPEAEELPKTLHLWFMKKSAVNPNFKKIEMLKNDSEQYKIIGTVFYLHAPEGIGRSKLASDVEKCLRVSATGRNWNTVAKISEMLTSVTSS